MTSIEGSRGKAPAMFELLPPTQPGRLRSYLRFAVPVATAAVLVALTFFALSVRTGSASSAAPGGPLDVTVSTPVNPLGAAINPDQADPLSATISWASPVTGGTPTGYVVTASPETTSTSQPGGSSSTTTSDPLSAMAKLAPEIPAVARRK